MRVYRPNVGRSGMTKRAIDPVIGRRAFCLSLGAGLTIVANPGVTGAADLKKVPMSTGIDAVFVPYVVAADRKIFEKYGLEASYKPFDDGNVALDAVLTGASDIGSTSELGGLARWDKGGKLYVTSSVITSELPPNWWTPLLSSDGSGKVSNEP